MEILMVHSRLTLFKALFFVIFTVFTGSNASNYILGGSIGRYDTQLGVFEVVDGELALIKLRECKTSAITNFTDFLTEFLAGLEQEDITIDRACFGVPGNTVDRLFIQAPHLSFPVDGQEMLDRGLLKEVFVLNDFEVQGYGIESVDPKNIIQINKGISRVHGTRVLVGAGAGLGSMLMIWDAAHKRYESLPLGACFTDFAPQTKEDLEFAAYIKEYVTHCDNCSWGQVLGSGSGLCGVYKYCRSLESRPSLKENLDAEDIFVYRDIDPLCDKAVKLYMQLYAQLIKNVAYMVLPYGGLYITNTVAVNHSELVTNPEFLNEIFNCRHDWLKNMLSEIPMYVVTDPSIPLYGAAQYVVHHANA